jgi:hypothetical protein
MMFSSRLSVRAKVLYPGACPRFARRHAFLTVPISPAWPTLTQKRWEGMMGEDRIGVRKYPVRAVRSHPLLEKEVQKRIDVMQRELTHLQHAVSRLRTALPNRAAPTSALADAVMDSRNWVVSLVMSHAFIQAMLAGDDPPNRDQVEKLAARAASLGEMDGARNLLLAKPGAANALRVLDQMNSLKPERLL